METVKFRMSAEWTIVLLTLGHFCVDGISGAVVSGTDLLLFYLLYHLLAFSIQPLWGILVDDVCHERQFILISGLMMVLSALLPGPMALRIILAGIGNSLYHASAGSVDMRDSGSIGPYGIFVAGGATGVASGYLWPLVMTPVFVTGMILVSALAFCYAIRELPEEENPETSPEDSRLLLPAALLMFAICVRAGSPHLSSMPWKDTTVEALLLSACIALGKGSGGFFVKRFGMAKVTLFSGVAGGLLLTFGGSSMVLSLLGTLCINLMMPITLWLLGKLFPKSPGFAFGLAASSIILGYLTGTVIAPLLGDGRKVFLLAGCLLSVLCVLLVERSSGEKAGYLQAGRNI